MKLVTPALEYLPSYIHALENGWSPDNTRPIEAPLEELAKIKENPQAFIASMTDIEAKGDDITLPDGSKVKRLPGYRKWMWDGDFCGGIGFRWQPGTSELPPHCLGHIGYSVPTWKQNRGYAKAMLAGILPEAKARGLEYVELTADPDNIASQKVILANGGVFMGMFQKGAEFGGKEGLRYRIYLEALKKP